MPKMPFSASRKPASERQPEQHLGGAPQSPPRLIERQSGGPEPGPGCDDPGKAARLPYCSLIAGHNATFRRLHVSNLLWIRVVLSPVQLVRRYRDDAGKVRHETLGLGNSKAVGEAIEVEPAGARRERARFTLTSFGPHIPMWLFNLPKPLFHK